MDRDRRDIDIQTMPKKIYKKEMFELKELGTILCLEANVPRKDEMIGEKYFEVNLLYDANEFSDRCNKIFF
jgi:hypothetical protein